MEEFELTVTGAEPLSGAARKPPVISLPVPTIRMPVELHEDVVLELRLSPRDVETLASASRSGRVKVRVVAHDDDSG